MITLKQLAELSGVSVRTVGRILQGHPYVAPDKRALVLELARQHNYTPNTAARNLRLQQKKFVGILFSNYTQTADVRKLNLINRQLIANGYWPLLGGVENFDQCRAMLREWSGIANYAVVLHETTPRNLDLIFEQEKLLPLEFIFADCACTGRKYSFSIDRAGSVCSMICELEKLNFRHIVYCGTLESRLDGINLARQNTHNIKISTLEYGCDFESGFQSGSAVIASGADAVFFDSDRMAMGFYRYAAANNIHIPEDISVIGFDDEELSDRLTPALTTLAHPGREIADTVIEIVTGNRLPQKKLLPMHFIKRRSLAAPACR